MVVTQLSCRSGVSIMEYEINVEDDIDNGNVDVNVIEHLYHNETLSIGNFTYGPPDRKMATQHVHRIPTTFGIVETFLAIQFVVENWKQDKSICYT
jgi:hypothetical protein